MLDCTINTSLSRIQVIKYAILTMVLVYLNWANLGASSSYLMVIPIITSINRNIIKIVSSFTLSLIS